MYLKNVIEFFSTLKFRFTLYYAILFALASSIVFLTIYFVLLVSMIKNADEELKVLTKEIIILSEKWEKIAPETTDIKHIQNDFDYEANEEGINKVFFVLFSSSGKIIASSNMKAWTGLLKHPGKLHQFIKKERFKTLEFSDKRGGDIRVCSTILDGYTLLVGKSLNKENALLTLYISVFISIFGFIIISGSVFGFLITRKALSGVKRVVRTANMIGTGFFNERVEIGKEGVEIKELAEAFNNMISRIQELISELKSVSDNIAHDLRTPITRIRSLLEITVNSNPEKKDLIEVSGIAVEECDSLIIMINTMLEIAQTESGASALNIGDIDICNMIDNAYKLFLPLADIKGISIYLEKPELPLMIKGDAIRLQRVISNILENAIKYTQEGGMIKLSAFCNDKQVCISIHDNGCGIKPEDQKHIFDRFYRCDSSRSKPGNGLGLSLALSIVNAHKGSITVESSENTGAEFKIILPIKY